MFTPVERGDDAGWRRLAMPAWMAEAVNPKRVCAVLTRQVPEFASGAVTLRDCEIKRCRLREDTGQWSGTYAFTVEGPSSHSEVVRLRGSLVPPGLPEPDGGGTQAPFGTEPWSCYLRELRLELRTQPPETKLLALPQLTDAEAARELLERSIRGAPAYRDLRIGACTPKVVRYKPGSRCTIVYQLEYPPGLPAGRHWPDTVVAKILSGVQGATIYRAMSALWASPLARSGSVAIAEPLAFLPELNVVVQRGIQEEQTLKKFLRFALSEGTPAAHSKLRGYLRKTARGLADLHRCGVSYGESVRWQDEFSEIRERNTLLAAYLPWQAEATTALLARLSRLAARYPADPARPAHGSFRPAQVLLHQEDVGFIDFDRFCQAEPALDLALFLTEIKHIGVSEMEADPEERRDEPYPEALIARLAQLEDMCRVFVNEYASVLPVSRHRIALWEALDLVTLLQGTWTKMKPERLPEAMFLLERHPIHSDHEYHER